MENEYYIVVDIEAAGPSPSDFALLSIGACTLENPRQTFYIELKPDSEKTVSQAMKIHNLSMVKLQNNGILPINALSTFAQWIKQVTPANAKAVFTAFNAPFDWMFVNDYFHRYLGHNPFGHKALDMKAFFMGLHQVSWEKTSHSNIVQYYNKKSNLTHHALEDAIAEAQLFELMLEEEKTNA